MDNPIRVGIIGAGLMGKRRAEALQKVGGAQLIAVAETDVQRLQEFAGQYSCDACSDWQELVKRNDIDVVIVSVPNKFTVPISIAALEQGKHLLVEKPFGRNVEEAEAIIQAAEKSGKIVKVGFNHRFHPGIWKAKELFDQGAIGKIIFIRARYGHGGRMGMEKEWRFNKEISGGGELLDQGVHIIDLCRWFAGEFNEVWGITEKKFWKSDVEDNAFAILRSKNITVSFHVSVTNWGNIFSFEVFGDKGALVIDGLGKRYGTETLKVGIRQEPFNDLKTEEFSYPSEVDTSWEEEWKNFIMALQGKEKLIGDVNDGLQTNRIVDAIYKSSKIKEPVNL